MNPGMLNKKIKISKHPLVPDGAGGFQESDSLDTVAVVWANINPLRGREYVQAQQDRAEITHKVTLRYRKDIDRACILDYENRKFEIMHIINIQEKNRYLELMCKEQI